MVSGKRRSRENRQALRQCETALRAVRSAISSDKVSRHIEAGASLGWREAWNESSAAGSGQSLLQWYVADVGLGEARVGENIHGRSLLKWRLVISDCILYHAVKYYKCATKDSQSCVSSL